MAKLMVLDIRNAKGPCRLSHGEVKKTHWSEIDLDINEWHIPAERMKIKQAHIVPLSKQAVAVLNRADKFWGIDGLVFPSALDENKPMSDNAMSKVLRDMGYRGKATPHGFRSSFSSAAYEKSDDSGIIFANRIIVEIKGLDRSGKV